MGRFGESATNFKSNFRWRALNHVVIVIFFSISHSFPMLAHVVMIRNQTTQLVYFVSSGSVFEYMKSTREQPWVGLVEFAINFKSNFRWRILKHVFIVNLSMVSH